MYSFAFSKSSKVLAMLQVIAFWYEIVCVEVYLGLAVKD